MEWKRFGSLKLVEHPKFGQVCSNCNEPVLSEGINEPHEKGRHWYCGNCDKTLWETRPTTEEERIRYSNVTQKTYTLDDIRKIYPRAYLKWSEEELICSFLIISEGKFSEKSKKEIDEDLVEIFGRQPNISSSRIGLVDYSEEVDKLEKSKAIYLLGKQVVCLACEHLSILTFKHLEKLAEKSSVNILEITKDYLISVLNNFKCQNCSEKKARIIE
jgi:hypothetical protein